MENFIREAFPRKEIENLKIETLVKKTMFIL